MDDAHEENIHYFEIFRTLYLHFPYLKWRDHAMSLTLRVPSYCAHLRQLILPAHHLRVSGPPLPVRIPMNQRHLNECNDGHDEKALDQRPIKLQEVADTYSEGIVCFVSF